MVSVARSSVISRSRHLCVAGVSKPYSFRLVLIIIYNLKLEYNIRSFGGNMIKLFHKLSSVVGSYRDGEWGSSRCWYLHPFQKINETIDKRNG